MTLKHFVRAGLIAVFMMAAPLSAGAQEQVAQFPGSAHSIDGYRVMAITAGVIAGAVVATFVTNGLIIPVYATVTGSGPGSGLLGGAIRLFGAVGGGLYADTWYLNR